MSNLFRSQKREPAFAFVIIGGSVISGIIILLSIILFHFIFGPSVDIFYLTAIFIGALLTTGFAFIKNNRAIRGVIFVAASLLIYLGFSQIPSLNLLLDTQSIFGNSTLLIREMLILYLLFIFSLIPIEQILLKVLSRGGRK